ncbi:hypothetical protein D3C72_2260140 [compost metagenome]
MRAPDALAALPHFAISLSTNAENDFGSSPTTTKPTLSSFCRISGEANAFTVA